MVKHYVAIARVSSREQEREGFSLEVQEEALFRYARQHDGEIVKFFRTGQAPIAPEETIEIYAFMTAADVSKARGGIPISIEEVVEAARTEGPRNQN